MPHLEQSMIDLLGCECIQILVCIPQRSHYGAWSYEVVQVVNYKLADVLKVMYCICLDLSTVHCALECRSSVCHVFYRVRGGVS